jgi:serine/threonine protein kinase
MGPMDPRDVVTVPESAGDEQEAPARLGRFELGRRLGEGGMGIVFEARDSLLDRAVALKVLHPGAGAGGPTARARLLREAQVLARLSHPNVVPVFEVGLAGDEIFVAMELVDGATLKQWMKEPHPWREIVDLFLAAGRGLAAVHALGLVHRDFKPSNVMIDRAGTPKVGDFGLVGLDDSSVSSEGSVPSTISGEDLTVTGSVMGTPAYMAPEQRRGDRADARADQFSFAKTLVEALTGRLPDADGATEVPKPLRRILARAMSQEPALRYPSMPALLADLARARRGAARWWIAAAAGAGFRRAQPTSRPTPEIGRAMIGSPRR